MGRLEVICGSQAAGGGLYSPGPTSEAPGTAMEGRAAEMINKWTGLVSSDKSATGKKDT